MKLEGKTALVTGTSPNIMGGIAEELAREGANLVCADIRADYAEKCASAIVAEGHDAMGVGCDVTDEDQVVAAISQATERFGGVDILVNGAAVFNFKGVLNMPVDEWRRQTDIILTGAFLFTKRVAHLMIQQNRKGNLDFTQNLEEATDAIMLGRRHSWLESEGFSLSAANADVQELPATLYH